MYTQDELPNGLDPITTVEDTDFAIVGDTSDSNRAKRITWANLKTTLITVFSALYAPISHTHTASEVTDFDTEVSNNTDVAANTAARHDAVTVTDSSEIDFTLTGQDITASLIAGSIDETKLDTSVNASLDLADSASQPGHTHTHADITDFDAELAGKTNTTAFTPTADYHPATKKYVDDNAGGGGSVEGTAVLSTGETGGVKFLREDGDGTSSWQAIPGGGDMLASTYDTDSSGVVDEAEVITGQGALATLNTVDTAQIDDEAVTFAKMQHISQNHFLGRDNAGSGDIEALSATQARAAMGLGTAATTDSTDYATTAQGALADTALQSYTETDPVVGAISGIVKSDGAGNISAAVAGTDYSAVSHTHTASEITDFDTEVANNSAVAANTLKRSYPAGDEAKLGTIEANAKDDQTGAEIKSLYESQPNTNAFTDTEKSKLGGIEDGATADQTDAEIATAYQNEVSFATQAEMEAGTETTERRVSPERIAQAIAALGGGGGSSAVPMTHLMMPLRSGFASYRPASAFVKDDFAYMANRNNNYALVRYRVNAGQMLLSNPGSSLYWIAPSNITSMTSIVSNDDFAYATTTTGSALTRLDVVAKTSSTMTVSGGSFAANSRIASDGTDLYVLSAGTTNMLRYSVSGTTATFQETITLPRIVSGTYGHACISNGHVYYASTRDILVKSTLAGSEVFTSESTSSARHYGFSQGHGFMAHNGYVYLIYQVHDSEDAVLSGVQIFDNYN